MVSRYLESFERWLGVRVLHRTTRQVSLTDAGEEALQRCRQMLELARDVQSVAGARRTTPAGKLRITTSTSFAGAYLADLRSHRCITHAYVGRTEFRLQRNGQTLRIPVRGPLQSNEAAVTRRAALAGAGIAMLPTYFVSAELASGELIRLLPDCEPEPLGIHAVYLSRQHQPRLLRMMVDFLADRMKGEVAPWDRVIASAAKQATSIARSRGSANGPVRPRPKAN